MSKTDPKPKKPTAAARTVDMFSGKTPLEEYQASTETVEETPKGSETIEEAAERWRNNAFFTEEFFSKRFKDNVPETAKFRLTEKDGCSFLEQFRLGRDGMAWHWAGVMFRTADLGELTSVLVAWWRAKNEGKKNNG